MVVKRGRPSIKYHSFVEVWERLVEEGRASINAVQSALGGDKRTIAAYREQYEREKSAKELSVIKSVELTEAVQRAIAGIKVKEIEALERENLQLKSRVDEYLLALSKAEEEYAALKVQLDEAKIEFDIERQKLGRKLAVAESRVEDAEKRERQMGERYESLAQEVSQHQQVAAVARKEVEMLREQAKLSPRGR